MPAEHLIPSMQDIIRKAEETRLAEIAALKAEEEALLNPDGVIGEESIPGNTSALQQADGRSSPSKSVMNKTGQSSKFKIKKNQSDSDSDSDSASDTSSFDSDESDLTAKKRAHRLKRRKSNTS